LYADALWIRGGCRIIEFINECITGLVIEAQQTGATDGVKYSSAVQVNLCIFISPEAGSQTKTQANKKNKNAYIARETTQYQYTQ